MPEKSVANAVTVVFRPAQCLYKEMFFLSSNPKITFFSGFAKNASYYPVFLSKLLQDSKDLMADKSFFKPVPPTPTKNQFEVGMKLEAIDRKNPFLIAPATIGKFYVVCRMALLKHFRSGWNDYLPSIIVVE